MFMAMPSQKPYGTVADVARKQVIVQLDDRLIADLDREATALGISRSELLRRAGQAFLRALDEARKEHAMIEAYGRVPEEPEEVAAMHLVSVLNWPEW
jgi:metal-responsive CopG/Arc/MetJ family transcriptional regulator